MMATATMQPDLSDLQAGSIAERNRAWRMVYAANFQVVHRTIRRAGIAPDEVEDLVQRVFEVAYRRMNDGQRVQNVGGWLHGIAVRVVSEHYRWARVRQAKAWLLRLVMVEAAETEAAPDRAAELSQVQQRMHEVLLAMKPHARDVFVAVDIDEMSPHEAAELLAIPVNTVRSRLRAAREDFRRRWAQSELKGGQDAR